MSDSSAAAACSRRRRSILLFNCSKRHCLHIALQLILLPDRQTSRLNRIVYFKSWGLSWHEINRSRTSAAILENPKFQIIGSVCVHRPVESSRQGVKEAKSNEHNRPNKDDKLSPDTAASPLFQLYFPTFPRVYFIFTVVQKLRIVNILQSRRGFKELCVKRMAWSVEKCNGNGVGTTRMGLVRPAMEDNAEEAIEAVKTGKVIAVPTDTLYGFACDACSMEAVKQIYEIKGRKYTSPLAICVGDVQDIQRFAVTDHLPHGLLDSLLPGPVTVVLRRGESSILEKSLNPGLDSIGVRVPDCSFIRAIARGSGSALALTSANLSGQPSSVDIKDFENLWEHCAYVYNGGVLPSGRAGSTVVDLTKLGKYKILRPGSAKEETVEILEQHALVEDSSTSSQST